MAEGIKTFGKKGEKGVELLDRIKTPTDKAIAGGVGDVLNDFMKDSNAQLLGAFFGTMVTGTKMNKGAFDGMMSNIAQNNIFAKMTGILGNIVSEFKTEEDTLKGHIVKMSEGIQTISDNFLSYLAMVPQNDSKPKTEGSMTYNIVLDTSKASDFANILKQIVELQPENVKNVEKLFTTASQISYIDMSSLQKYFIEPLNSLQDLKYAEIIAITQELVNSDMFINLQDVFSALSGISFENEEIVGAFEALDTFTASLIKYNELDIDALKLLPQKLELIASIISNDISETANLQYIFEKVNNVGEVNPGMYAAVKGLAVMTAHLLMLSDALDKQSAKEILDSIKELSKIVTELATVIPEIEKNGEAISSALETYNNNIDIALTHSQAANDKMSQLVSNYTATNDKLKEAKKSSNGIDYKEMTVTLNDLGTTIALMGATMLIGGYIVTKNLDILAGSFKFAVALTAFMTMILIPIALVNIIYSKTGTTQQSIDGVVRLVTGLSLIMILGGIVYSLGGIGLSKNAIRFAKDLAVFLTLILLPIALISLISKGSVLEELDNVANLIVKSAIVMILGALIVNNDALVKSSLKFGIVLGTFLLLTLTPIAIFGAMIGKIAMKYINDIGKFIIICTVVMLIGALFMSNDALWKQSLRFGVLLMAFTGLVLLPFVIFGTIIGSKKTELFIRSLAGMIIAFSLILMVGGMFMTWGNGKYALGAKKFALLVFLFTASMVLIVALVSLFMNEKAMMAIRQFGLMIVLFTTLLIIGALFMMVDGFGEAAISFGILVVSFTVIMGIVLGIISKFITKDTLIGVAEFGIMVALLAVSLIIGGLAVKLIGYEAMLTFAAMIAVMVGAVILYVKLTSKIDPAQMVISMGVMLMFSISIAILGGAFFIAKKAVENFSWEDYGMLFALVGGFVAIFALVGIPYVSALVSVASVAFILMGVALTSLSIGIWMMHAIVSGFGQFDVMKEIDLFNKILLKLSAVFALIGVLSLLIAPASAAVSLMSVAISLFSGAMFLVNALIDNNQNADDNLSTISKWLLAMGGIFSLLGLLSPVIFLGSGVLVMLSAALVTFDLAMGGVILVVNSSKDLKPKDLENFGAVLKGFFKAIQEGLPGPLTILKLIAKVAGVSAFVVPLGIMMGLLGTSIKDFASLSIADEWNPKTGKPVHYRQLTSNDFTAVIENISLIVDTFTTALDQIYNKHSALIDEASSDSIFSVVMGKPKSSLLKTIKMANMLGRCIGTLAESLSNISKLMIPDKWNKDGKPIHFRMLTDDDFGKAADGIKRIITTVGQALIDFATENPTWVEDFKGDGGFLGLSSGKSTFGAVLKMSIGIGDMVSKIAQSINDYAQMKIPTGWDASGNPTGYRKITDKDFIDCAENIKLIMGELGKAIKEGYDEGYSKKLKSDNLDVMFATIGNATNMLADVAETLSKMGEFKFEDEDGNIVPLNLKIISKASTNIYDIMTMIPDALLRASKKFSDSETKKIFEISNSFKPMGELISSLVEAIQNYADLRIPTKYNNEGKAIEFRPINLDESLDQMAINMSTIMIGMGYAIAKAYDEFTIKDKSPQAIEEIISALEPIGNVFSNIIGAVQDYANLKIPDKYKSDGSVATYKNVNDKNLDGYFTQMKNNLSNILKNLLGVFADRQITSILEKMSNEKYTEYYTTINNVTGVIKNIVDTIKSFSDLKIPKEFNNDGSVKSYMVLDDQTIPLMKANITSILEAIPQAVIDSYETMNILDSDNKKLELIQKVIKKHSMLVLDNIDALVKKYNAIKTTLKDVDIKDVVGGLLNNVADMYIDFTNKFSSIEQSEAMFTNVEAKIQGVVTAVTNITSMLEKTMSNTSNDSDNLIGGFNFLKKKKTPDIVTTISTFAKITADLDKAIRRIIKTLEVTNEIPNVSITPISNLLNYVIMHSQKIDDKDLKKFGKEALALEKFTKSVDRINTSKLSKLMMLFETMEKWHESVGNLDEFTKALAEELATTLAKLTDEIRDAKKVIKTSDDQRAKRQKQLNESIEKIDKLMKQTLHVNVSQQKGNTITSAWEKPND